MNRVAPLRWVLFPGFVHPVGAATPARSGFGGLIRSLPDSLPRVVARYRPASKCFSRADADTTSPIGRNSVAMPIVAEQYTFVIGVDTHAATHSLALVTATTGAVVDQAVFPNTPPGHGRALSWITRRIGEHSTLVVI
jgi:transposase